jgi:hypothetical protein
VVEIELNKGALESCGLLEYLLDRHLAPLQQQVPAEGVNAELDRHRTAMFSQAGRVVHKAIESRGLNSAHHVLFNGDHTRCGPHVMLHVDNSTTAP